jgi:hypothetical protein
VDNTVRAATGRGLVGTIFIGLLGVIISAGVNLLTPLVATEWVHRWRWWLTVAVFVAVVAPAVWQRRAFPHDSVLRAVAAVDVGDGSMEVIAATKAGTVVSATYRQTGGWSGWTDRNAEGVTWDVTAVMPTRDVVEFFAVDRNGVLRMCRRDHAEWSAWQFVPPGGFRHGRLLRIAAVSLKAGHREVFAVTDTERLVHSWKSDGSPWSEWHDAGLGHCIEVAACSPKDDLIEAFVVDRDGDVWHRWFWVDHWSDWEKWGRPGSPGKAVTAFRRATDRQEMFVVGKAGDLGHRWHDGGGPWSGWAAMETPFDLDDVAAATTSADRLQCVGLDREGRLWLRSYDEGWAAWRQVVR